MKEPEFPFAKYRDWGPVPKQRPQIDTEALHDLEQWQERFYKRPILDDITGYYQFYPSENGANNYVQRAALRRPVLPQKVEAHDTFEDKSKRQLEHIASKAELATALFWTVAVKRHDVVEKALMTFTPSVVDRQVSFNEDDQAYITAYAADAIADYGYCLLHPVDIDHGGIDHGPALKKQIERVAPGIGQTLLDFGSFAGENPEELATPQGELALQATLLEQERRWRHWSPRHEAIVSVFPQIGLSREVLEMVEDFPHMFELHHEIKAS